MATDFREQIKTVDEIRDATTFLYAPKAMALSNKVRYDASAADEHKFQTFDIVKDSVKAEILTTEQTEKHHIKGRTTQRIFNLYLAGAKAIVSFRNKYMNLQKANDKVVREYSILFDRWAMLGNRGNNGILVSNDPNYTTNDNVQIPAVVDGGWNQVKAMSDAFSALLLQIDATTGDNDIIVYTYGDQLNAFLSSFTEQNETVIRVLMQQKFEGKNVRFIHVPAIVLAGSALANQNGIVVVADNLTTMEYTQEPTVRNNGTNDENEYYWANYVMGSVQVSPDEPGAIIKQPITFA